MADKMKTLVETSVRPMIRTKKVFLHTHIEAYNHIFNLCCSPLEDAAEIKVTHEFRKQW